MNWLKKHRGVMTALAIMILIWFAIDDPLLTAINDYRYGMSDYEIDSFNEDYICFRRLADEMYEHFETAGEGIVSVRIEPLLESYVAYYTYEDASKNREEEHFKSEWEYDCFYRIAEAFHQGEQGRFEGITVMKDRVAFRRTQPYAIVYMKSLFKPHYFADPETDTLYAKRILPHWYHCLNLHDDEYNN